jgi:hypothetical protein
MAFDEDKMDVKWRSHPIDKQNQGGTAEIVSEVYSYAGRADKIRVIEEGSGARGEYTTPLLKGVSAEVLLQLVPLMVDALNYMGHKVEIKIGKAKKTKAA